MMSSFLQVAHTHCSFFSYTAGPDFSKILSYKDNPELIDAESERITKIIERKRL